MLPLTSHSLLTLLNVSYDKLSQLTSVDGWVCLSQFLLSVLIHLFWKRTFSGIGVYGSFLSSNQQCQSTEGNKFTQLIFKSNNRQIPHHTTPQPFNGLFPGPSGWTGVRRELLDFMVQGKINRGRHTDHPAGRHSIRTNQCPTPPSPHFFYRPDALPAAQSTVSKHWRQLVHLD